jgi:Tfp pilus assembly protein PilX
MHKNIRIMLRLKDSEKGFALIAAIMACLVLLALGMLVISLSTQDLKVSTKIVGDKRSLAAVEQGVQTLSQQFNPQTAPTIPTTVNRPDGKSSYTINYPVAFPTRGPELIDPPGGGYAVGWKMKRYDTTVVGRNAEYNTQVTVGVGMGYGPVPGPGPYQ